ncbi:hypothetical protein CJU90_3799 [Yarrowia sp. C11]|nr:hypothetical protein CKK34_5409 [Yarrowia sp. E02]KAG5367502.1 hypothetical protein CJU90_3799 [Yarrowia sp. C11]
MGLKLASKKSYHPGKEANKARVARDEQQEAESREKALLSERQDRFSVLRQKAGLVDNVVEAKREHAQDSIGSLQTFSKVVDHPQRVKKRANKMDPELAKAKMDPLADMNRFLEETEAWERSGAPEEVSGDDTVDVRVPRKRKKRSHRVTKRRSER